MKNTKQHAKKTLLFLLLTILLSACSAGGRSEQSPLLGFFERKSGKIAYIGLDGNIYTMDQNAGDIQSITEDAYIPSESSPELLVYQLPTWAPNSQNLAFVGLERGGEGLQDNNATIYTYNTDDDDETNDITKITERFPEISMSRDPWNAGFLSIQPRLELGQYREQL